MKPILVLAIVSLLAGCASRQFVPPPGATPEDQARQLAKCNADSQMLPTNMMGAPFGNSHRKRYLFDCMRAQGYTVERPK